MIAMHTYKGYKLTSRLSADGMKGEVSVFHPSDKRGPALYKTTSLDLGMRWVDAYIKGEQWAIDDLNPNAMEPPRQDDDGSCDPLYGQRMDSADMGEN